MVDQDEFEELETRTAEHLNDLLAEVVRRDEWIISSLWNVVVGLSQLTTTVIVGFFVLFTGITQWWQILMALIVVWLLNYFQTKRLRQLEAEEKGRIGRAGLLGVFGTWWK